MYCFWMSRDRWKSTIGIFSLCCLLNASANHKFFWQNKKGFPLLVSGVPPDAFSETGQLWGRCVMHLSHSHGWLLFSDEICFPFSRSSYIWSYSLPIFAEWIFLDQVVKKAHSIFYHTILCIIRVIFFCDLHSTEKLDLVPPP